MENLPREIIEDILLRLPVKSLQRSKCVCKNWCSIISQPQFAKIHLHRPQTQARTRLCIVNSKERSDINVVRNGNGDNGELLDLDCLTDIKNIMNSTNHGYILDSCDGLLCLVDSYHHVVLWNPFTRQYNHLPINHHHVYRGNYDYFRIVPGVGYVVDGYKIENFYGFGYDSCSDDYKLIAGYFWDYDNNSRIDVFSLKSNDWRSIIIHSEKDHATILYEKGVFLHGAAHWIAASSSSSDPIILAFDFEEKKFKEMAIPVKNYGARLQVIEGHLYVYDCKEYLKEKWVMKDYGVEASWTKLASPYSYPYPSKYQLLDFLNNQHLLLINDEKVVLWDHKENIENDAMTYEKLLISEITFFTETLVSPYSC